MDASDVMALLMAKHARDLCVPECKDGPTWHRPHVRMDLWAMRRSWTRPYTYGYEIKVARSDFLTDDKWPRYLGLCNFFAFVCPAGIIQRDECPDGVGLLWVSSNGTKLMTKRKAPYKDADLDENLARYVLMCRAVIAAPGANVEKGPDEQRHFRAAYWKRWLASKREMHGIGRLVSRALSERIDSDVDAVKRENRILQRQIDNLNRVVEFCTANGIDVESFQVREKLMELRHGIPNDDRKALQLARDAIDGILARAVAVT